MLLKALPAAAKYKLQEIVDPNSSSSPDERAKAASELCEKMLDEKNWKMFYLHHHTEKVSVVCRFIPLPTNFVSLIQGR